MSKMDQSIMVVETNTLLGSKYFTGFLSSHEHDYEASILKHLKYMRRGDAEIDPTHKQPIAYCMIINQDKKVYAYQRSKKDANYGEKRLQGKWSWGIGGHIEEVDNEGDKNPIYESMLRELEEEIHIDGEVLNIKALGYINYDDDEVSKVHFGILYMIETDAETITPNDGEIANGEFRSIEELEEICNNDEYDVESWSRVALEALKRN